ncbi:MAG: GNAT family N-acetyltransferase [Dehalococcoidales bacterium]|nr:GNAT family N-acetyltransferase [Dehalococcoidales bacterium]
MTVENGLIRVDKADAGKAIESLSRAFFEYPLLRYFYPDEDRRRKNTRLFMEMAVFLGLKHGEVYTTSEDFEGVSIWLPPGKFPISGMGTLRAVPLRVFFGMARSDFWKMKDVGTHIDEVHSRLVPFKHAYLQTLGVAPEYQGKGFSGKLVRPVLSQIDIEGLPAFVETMDRKNVDIYRRFGFELIDESNIPGTELTNWAMLREARNC